MSNENYLRWMEDGASGGRKREKEYSRRIGEGGEDFGGGFGMSSRERKLSGRRERIRVVKQDRSSV